MNRPLLLDLFCKAGGAGMGYWRAGFDVVGVDEEAQKRYPFAFVQADAIEYVSREGHRFDAVHASPPCQAHCALRYMPNAKQHLDLIPQTRAALRQSGKPFVIENVRGAPLFDPVVLCGTMFGLQTDCGAELRRHRLFEANWPLKCDLECRHSRRISTISVHGDHPRDSAVEWANRVIGIHGDKARDLGMQQRSAGKTLHVAGSNPWTGHIQQKPRTICVNGTGLPLTGGKTITVTGSTPQQNVVRNKQRECFSVSAARTAMGISWMVMAELSQAIPPAYTEYVGLKLIAFLQGVL